MGPRLKIDRQHEGRLTGGQIRPIRLYRSAGDVQPQAKRLLIESRKLIQLLPLRPCLNATVLSTPLGESICILWKESP